MKTDEMKCPVCQTGVDAFDICDVCGWQNSGSNEGDYDPKGPNKLYLWEAKAEYQAKCKDRHLA